MSLASGLRQPHAPLQHGRPLPLVLDLDGTVLKTDLLWECFLAALKRRPAVLVLVLIWLVRGRAILKRRLAEIVELDVSLLPLDERLVEFAAAEAAKGREVSVATAADETLARRVAARLGFVTSVLASDGSTNLKGHAKAARLLRAFPGGFVYAGDGPADIPVFHAASETILVRPDAATERAARAVRPPMLVLPRVPVGPRLMAQALRLKQWAKNALVLVPIPLAGRALDPSAWAHGLAAFLALGLVASATYLVNDLLDLAEDRRHWSKRDRPLASGALPLAHGMALVPVVGACGLALAAWAGPAVAATIALYAVVTIAYSVRLKRIPILDVTLLAALFTLRLFVGVVAIGAIISPWLFVFSMALFLSLSIAKRHTEVVRMVAHGLSEAAGRGYRACDAVLLLALGVASAASAIVLLTLYLTAEAFRAAFYTAPAFLWLAPIVLMLWLGRIWLLSQRGELDDDPVAFALRDGPSLALGVALGLAFGAASFGGLLA